MEKRAEVGREEKIRVKQRKENNEETDEKR